jgi:hypothetical protein
MCVVEFDTLLKYINILNKGFYRIPKVWMDLAGFVVLAGASVQTLLHVVPFLYPERF